MILRQPLINASDVDAFVSELKTNGFVDIEVVSKKALGEVTDNSEAVQKALNVENTKDVVVVEVLAKKPQYELGAKATLSFAKKPVKVVKVEGRQIIKVLVIYSKNSFANI